eukprot:1161278-Pelagomonas_calceolata.AAC.10
MHAGKAGECNGKCSRITGKAATVAKTGRAGKCACVWRQSRQVQQQMQRQLQLSPRQCGRMQQQMQRQMQLSPRQCRQTQQQMQHSHRQTNAVINVAANASMQAQAKQATAAETQAKQPHLNRMHAAAALNTVLLLLVEHLHGNEAVLHRGQQARQSQGVLFRAMLMAQPTTHRAPLCGDSNSGLKCNGHPHGLLLPHHRSGRSGRGNEEGRGHAQGCCLAWGAR